jgi:virulence factor Mce-like protein
MKDRLSSGLTRERLALELRRSRGPFAIWLGLLVLAVGAGGVILKNMNNQYPWEDVYEVRVAIDDAKGVVPELQDVRISGVPVGTITKSELVANRPVLTLSIDREHAPLYRDARLRLRPQTPLQDLYVDVEDRGTPAAGELTAGDIFPAARTQVPVQVSDVLNVFDQPTRARYEVALDEMGRGLDDGGDQLRAAFAEMVPFLHAARRMNRVTAERRRHTRRLIHNFRLLAEELARRDGVVTRLVASGHTTLGELASNDEALERTIAELPPTMRQLDRSLTVLQPALDELDPALDALRRAASALEPGLEALRAFSTDASPALQALRRPVRELAPTVRALRPPIGDLDPAFARLRPQAPRLDRITALVSACKLGFQKFFQWTPSVFKMGDTHGAVPRGEQTIAPADAGGQTRDPNLRRSPSCTDGRGGSR